MMYFNVEARDRYFDRPRFWLYICGMSQRGSDLPEATHPDRVKTSWSLQSGVQNDHGAVQQKQLQRG